MGARLRWRAASPPARRFSQLPECLTREVTLARSPASATRTRLSMEAGVCFCGRRDFTFGMRETIRVFAHRYLCLFGATACIRDAKSFQTVQMALVDCYNPEGKIGISAASFNSCRADPGDCVPITHPRRVLPLCHAQCTSPVPASPARAGRRVARVFSTTLCWRKPGLAVTDQVNENQA